MFLNIISKGSRYCKYIQLQLQTITSVNFFIIKIRDLCLKIKSIKYRMVNSLFILLLQSYNQTSHQTG